MFEFFSKKNFLVDRLEHFVDIHNHVLPGIDDGAKTSEESVSLIRDLKSIGINKMIATPHIMSGIYPNNRDSIIQASETLKQALSLEEITSVAIDAAAEHMMDDGFVELVDQGRVMPIRQRYLLMEISFFQMPLFFENAIIKVAQKGFVPILAHPERYSYLHNKPNKYESFSAQGIMLQLNLLSLGDYYGKSIQKMAWKLIDAGLIDFLGTDLHNQRQFRALRQITMSNNRLDKIRPIIRNNIETFY